MGRDSVFLLSHTMQTVMGVARSNFSVLYDVTVKYEMCDDKGSGQAMPPGSIGEWMMGRPQHVSRLTTLEASGV